MRKIIALLMGSVSTLAWATPAGAETKHLICHYQNNLWTEVTPATLLLDEVDRRIEWNSGANRFNPDGSVQPMPPTFTASAEFKDNAIDFQLDGSPFELDRYSGQLIRYNSNRSSADATWNCQAETRQF